MHIRIVVYIYIDCISVWKKNPVKWPSLSGKTWRVCILIRGVKLLYEWMMRAGQLGGTGTLSSLDSIYKMGIAAESKQHGNCICFGFADLIYLESTRNPMPCTAEEWKGETDPDQALVSLCDAHAFRF